MIVAVPERTVVTAMPTDQAGQGIFTNIDAAVVASHRSLATPAVDDEETKGPAGPAVPAARKMRPRVREPGAGRPGAAAQT